MSLRSRESHEPAQISKLWDAVVAGEPADARLGTSDVFETIRSTHSLAEVPGPDPDLVARMWSDALARVEHGETEARQRAFELGRTRGASEVFPRVDQFCTRVVNVVGAGALVGLITIGVGMRLAMRISAAMSGGQVQNRLTDNGNRVGEITFSGSLVLLLMGTGLGAMLGLSYFVMKPWLPWSGWKRGLALGVIVFALGGTTLFEHGRNPDYRQFGVAGVNVCLFSLLPMLYGALAAPVMDRVDARSANRNRSRSPDVSWARFASKMALAGLALAGAAWSVHVAPQFALIAVLALTRLFINRSLGRFGTPADLLGRPRLAFAAYALLVAPVLAGLLSTLLAIERILI